jgi:TolB-like protein/class 3 adenylate cyclase/Flp pilus assembly protein TadD
VASQWARRRVIAVLAADFIGAGKEGQSGSKAVAEIDSYRREVFDPALLKYHGFLIRNDADGLLVEFASLVDVVECAVELQQELAKRNARHRKSQRFALRMGVHIGEVRFEDDRFMGDGVTVAEHLKGLVNLGGTCVSEYVQQSLAEKVDLHFVDLGELDNTALGASRAYSIPLPDDKKSAMDVDQLTAVDGKNTSGNKRLWAAALGVVVVVVVAGGALLSFEPRIREAVASLPLVRALGLIQTAPSLPLPAQPAIAVLPFRNLTGDLELDYLSDGLTRQVIADLSGFDELFVIDDDSTILFKNRSVKVQEVRDRLGVHYLLAGNLRTTNEHLEINAELFDTDSQASIWQGRLDGPVRDFLSLQDSLVDQVLQALPVQVNQAARDRALKKATDNFTAYDFYLRGDERSLEKTSKASAEAERLYRKAIDLDPAFAQAYAALAWQRIDAVRHGWNNAGKTSLNKAREAAEKAISLDPSDPLAHRTLGILELRSRRASQAVSAYERALAVAPNDPDLMIDMATALVYVGRAEQAVERINRAMRTNPLQAERYLGVLGWSTYQAGRYEEALAALEKIEDPSGGALRSLAATYAQLGLVDQAKEEARKALKREPDYHVAKERSHPYQSHVALEHWLEGLRKAGLPE